MNVELTPDQRAFVEKAIESGRIGGEEESVQQALALWEERERRRLEIVAIIDEADASLWLGLPTRRSHVRIMMGEPFDQNGESETR